MNYTLSRILGWIADNKLSTFLGICLFAFVISTIALASQKSHLQEQLEDCQAASGKPGGGGNGTTPGGNGTSTEQPPEKPPTEGEPGKPSSRTSFRLRRNVGV